MTQNNYDHILVQAEEYEDQLDMLNSADRKPPEIPASCCGPVPDNRMAIVIGHTERSPGARGAEPVSTYEYYWNRELADRIRQYAGEAGVQCGLFYRDGVGISGAYQQVADWAPHTCVELHFNAFNKQVTGTETLCGQYARSKGWAGLVQQSMVSVFDREAGGGDRGIKLRKTGERGGKSVNQLDTAPSCLIEPYFGDADEDARLARDRFDALARAIVDAHTAYLA